MLRMLAAVVLVSLAAADARQPQAGSGTEIRFRWALGAITGPASARKFVRVVDDVTLHTGDELKLFVSPVTACFVYVLHEDPRGELAVLFPENANFPAAYRSGAPYYVPSGKDWFSLDEVTGVERIYLVAAAQRLDRLEGILKRHAAAPAAARAAIVKETIGELASLRRRHATRPWSERPVTIGGQMRSIDRPDLATVASEVTGTDFVSRVYIIDHR